MALAFYCNQEDFLSLEAFPSPLNVSQKGTECPISMKRELMLIWLIYYSATALIEPSYKS